MPAEHGGWGFLSEPILLGLILAPTLAGLGIGAAAAALFLVHQPLKIVIKDTRKGRMYERTRLAARFAALYGIIGVVGMLIALATAKNRAFLLPLVLSLPLAGVQLAYELRNDARSLVSEIFGALALAATAPAFVLAADQSGVVAMVAWGVLAMRIVPAILYVRARLRLIHGKPANVSLALGLHTIAVVIGVALWISGQTTALILLGVGVLLVRAVHGLKIAKPVPAKTVGFQELFVGLFYAVVCGVGIVL